ncbi:MAG: hypothetical protein HYX92_16845 [Chloroflexi bacterium]|nr:hypothetical protein [Chloroflexota bacterium]
MVRASAAVERAGVRAVSIVASGFVRQAAAIARAMGVENLPVAEYPGLPMVDSPEDLRRKVEEVIAGSIIKGLTTPIEGGASVPEPEAKDIVFKGTLDEVEEFFYRKMWLEGLPVIPPTLDRVEKFLRFTDRDPDEVLEVLLPENRQATVWNVAVNGVMAGCRPEYMPVLIAVVECISDPEWRIEDAGSTPGWEPLIILNGPIIKELDFNCGASVMRVGRKANTSVGRFLRLYMRNVSGLRILPGLTDKGSIAQSFNVVLAENEDAVREIGWQPFSVDRGFNAGDNVVTVQSCVSISPPCYSSGSTALEHMETVAELIGRRAMGYWTGICARSRKMFPLFCLGPSIAAVIARDGWQKDDIRKYLYDNVRGRAGYMEYLVVQDNGSRETFCDLYRQGHVSKAFCESEDPERMIPIFLRPEWIEIVVSGDPGRNQSKGYMENQKQGPPVSRKIVLPAKRRAGVGG